MHLASFHCGSKFFTQTRGNFYPNTYKFLHAKFYTLKPNRAKRSSSTVDKQCQLVQRVLGVGDTPRSTSGRSRRTSQRLPSLSVVNVVRVIVFHWERCESTAPSGRCTCPELWYYLRARCGSRQLMAEFPNSLQIQHQAKLRL